MAEHRIVASKKRVRFSPIALYNLKGGFSSMNTENRDREEGLSLKLNFDKMGGILPAIVQDFNTGNILMLGYVNKEALEETLRTNYATFWKPYVNTLWRKGEDSGNRLSVLRVLVDCDQDALVYQVEAEGKIVCDTIDRSGNERQSCFYRKIIVGKTELASI
ncbi:MAG: phosphoribosyl-AMP cyclohydrolase [Nanoarchaeota archaeon]|nr:phosphoribosyl-AMP cyclohydrolase [Nanoarchaeota archaeon]